MNLPNLVAIQLPSYPTLTVLQSLECNTSGYELYFFSTVWCSAVRNFVKVNNEGYEEYEEQAPEKFLAALAALGAAWQSRSHFKEGIAGLHSTAQYYICNQ